MTHFIAMLAACVLGLSSGSRGADGPTSVVAEDAIQTIRVMTYNIWVGGEKGEPDAASSKRQTVEVMRQAQADIICMQEQSGNAEFYAKELGFHVLVQDNSTAILSRFEIVEPTERKWGAKVKLPGRGVMWVFNLHFPAAPYQPYQLTGIPYHNGRFVSSAADAVVEARLARGENAIRCVREMQPGLRSGEPIIVAGDFNEPSHLDWTPEAVKARSLPVAVEWPTTKLFFDAGLRDAYRAVNPDPVSKQGFTWTPRPDARDVMDRIDLVMFAGTGVRVLDAAIVGEKTPEADLVVAPYPSDHRAVVVTLELPAPEVNK